MMPLNVLLLAIAMTVAITLGAFLIGAVLGVPLMFARISRFAVLRVVSRAVVDVLRGIPPVVWIFLLYFGLSSSLIKVPPFPAAVIALGVVSAAYLAEIYRGGMISVHRGQHEAARALGMNQTTAFFRVIAPQAIRVSIPSAATYGIGLLKDSTLASTIGVAEIVFRSTAVARATGDGITPFLIAGLLYIGLSLPLAYFSRTIESRLRSKVSV